MVFSGRGIAGPSSIRSALAHQMRHFSVSPAARAGNSHYDTLDVPRNATRSQIKTSFYKISKVYHPDVNSSAEAKAKFQAASEAYSVLGDERQRRAYDRTLSVGPSHSHQQHYHRHPAASHDYDPGAWAFETRRRGASYAWEKARHQSRSWYGRPPPGMHYDPSEFDPFSPHPQGHRARANTHFSQTNSQGDHPLRTPWSSANVRKATGKNNPFSEEQRIQHISPLGRALGVVALVLAVATIGGGWSAKT
ncbi:DnaJ-domain-containing protein [Punctularia strigosozonata HHB-11173 SS5]|uniref:DnaJ-domain-containing protein n=1 Tax=Punctularia strigosozonata (strain HHB-11173) TaxID=741275 RepID=UPI0004418246|nr:DnaJ-domain-containing protein [Punctularia strigosozonata HHB-11173 SS5]EIN13825.1 DnaJ-domain-containing protein [Punctularia strigosozonata HHB-11173 SS5]